MESLRRLWVRVSAWLVPGAIVALGAIDLAQNGSLSAEGAKASFPGPAAVHVLFLLAVTVPLYWRYRAPARVSVVVTTAGAAWVLAMFNHAVQPPFEPALAIWVALFALASSTAGRALWIGTTYVGAVFCAGEIVGALAGQGIGNVFPALLGFSVVWFLGRVVYQHRRNAAGEHARADRLQRAQAQLAVQAAADERARIARELHDVVAHSLSVIVVQAAAERRVLDADRTDTAAVLSAIEDTGRQAMVELRRLLGLLRKADPTTERAPQPGLARLGELVDEVQRSGVHVDVTIAGDTTTLPPGIDVSAYRIIQEALTNVLKHAHACDVNLTVRAGPRTLHIQVTDDGQPTTSTHAGGFGLIGMRERISIYGGTLRSGPRPDTHGYQVDASLPFDAPEPCFP